MMINDIRLPRLRQDLTIQESDPAMDGSPNWVIYDPVADNYFKIGWFEYECIKHFGEAKSAFELTQVLREKTTLKPSLDDVKDFVSFLLFGRLCAPDDPAVKEYLEGEYSQKQPPLIMRLVHQYLFFKLPMFRPQKFLKATYPYVAFMFTRGFFYFMMTLLMVGLFMTVQRWDEFSLTFASFFNAEIILLIFLSTIVIKVCHEMGHAYTATKYGVPVSSMGIAFIVMYPIFYTETTNAWRLYDRKKRMNIAAAGLKAEIFLASVALIIWHMLQPGFLQNLAFFVAFLSLAASFFINMNPLMKFDGYYLFSDFVGVDNLQDRSILMFKWWLRKTLFGLDDDAPEPMNRQSRFLIAFGIALVIYRFFLFLGIALLVYALVFKPLGLILMLFELFWFIGMPVMREVYVWYQERHRIVAQNKGRFVLLVVTLLLIATFLPIKDTVKVPAMLHSAQFFTAYAPLPSQVETLHVEEGEAVRQGDMLVSLTSTDLDYDIMRVKADLNYYRTLRERLRTSRDLLREEITIDEEIDELKTELAGLETVRENLQIRAPFDGVVKDVNRLVHEGRFVADTVDILRVVQPNSIEVTGYLSENDVSRIEHGMEGAFYRDSLFSDGFAVMVDEVGGNETRTVAFEDLLSVYGGPVPSDASQGGKEAVTRSPLYVVNFDVAGDFRGRGLKYAERGIIFLEGIPTSLAEQMFKNFAALFIREVSL